MLEVEADLKKKERNWMIFPEGTRIRDQMLPVAPFHRGTFRPAQKAKVTILPAATYGTFRVLKVHPQFKRYPVSVSFLKPITPEEYAGLNTSDLAEITRNMVQKEITYHLRPLDHKIMSENKEKAYKFNAIL
jgi:1-acyl-sn-glycerol-3-phosphate acyltransferase